MYSATEAKNLLLNEVQGPIKQESVTPAVTPQFVMNNSPTTQPKNYHPPYNGDHSVPTEYEQYSTPDSNQYIPQHSISSNTTDYNEHYYYDYFTDPNALRPTFSASSNSCSSSETDNPHGPPPPLPGAVINDNGAVIQQQPHFHNNAGHHFGYGHEAEPHVGPIHHEYSSVIVEAPQNYQIHDEFVH